MNENRLEIALYGKGGIGKSTVSANLSAALAARGKKVLQIGCDPKHDSTRLLMGGRALPTVLDYLREHPEGKDSLADIGLVLGTGFMGAGCIEAGGPRPGVGCAGRGIISAFEFLEKHRVKENYDIVLYDVLGDVVCGGFAVPIRREYAGAIFLVTSGEFMAIYAANNILRGIRNFDGGRYKRVAGIIFNSRNVPGEELRVRRFAEAVSLPVCAEIPRSEAFSRAEQQGCTLMQLEGAGAEKAVFEALAALIGPDMPLYEARPLSDEQLEQAVLHGAAFSTFEEAESAAPPEEKGPSPLPEIDISQRPDPARRPLYGCALNGAATAAVNLTDAVIIAHSPRSCAFYTWQNISSPGRKNLFNRGILMPSAISPNLECTEMGRAEAVFGGMESLRRSIAAALEKKPGAVIVISSCVSGIIGDDITAAEEMSTPETPVIAVRAEGDINGDYMAGIEMCLHAIAERLVDEGAEERPRCVNIIGEAGVANNLSVNYEIISTLLARMGIEVNCRFLGGAQVSQVRRLKAAPLNLLASDGEDNIRLRGYLESRFGCRFFEGCLPVGFRATARFLEEIGEFFGCREAAAPIIEKEKALYKAEAARLAPRLRGKRILMTTINANLDWLIDAARAVGMEFVWIGVLNYLHRELSVTAFPERGAFIEEIADWPAVTAKIKELKPDIVLSNYTSAVPEGDYIMDNMPMGQLLGFRSGLELMDRWARLGENRREGDWTRDRELFEKYYS